MLDHGVAEIAVSDQMFDVEADKRRRQALDMPPQLPLADAVRVATQQTGSGTSWLSGFWRCLNGPGKLSAAEYFYYRLYADGVTDAMRARYVGKAMQAKMHRACCDPRWFAAAMDKLFFISAMRGAGIPVPATEAFFSTGGRRQHDLAVTSDRAMEQFLNDTANYPLFAKPVDGMYSVGAMSLTDVSDGVIHVRGAGNVAINDVIDYMRAMSDEGYLLQKTLRPAPDIADVCGGTLATVRMLMLLTPDGPQLESAVIKLPVSDNIADNYWRTGNMLGALDVETGTIERIVTGTGPELRELETHPVTGETLTGLRLPDWHAAIDVCTRGAAALPGLQTQSWDIALTPKGPVAMEVNWGGDLNLHQLAHGRGVLTPSFVRHLQNCGYQGKLPLGQ